MIGIDIENISRIKNLYINKRRLLENMFNKSEWEYAVTKANPSQTLTGIWCAKEAVLKAVYPSSQLFIKDITIRHRDTGVPYVIIDGQEIASERIKVSISHAKDYATAVAILL